MIKSGKQKAKALRQLEQIRNENNSAKNAEIQKLEEELEEYENLKAGKIELPEDITFLEIIGYISKIRIAKGFSQKDLAGMLGITKQAINHHEKYNYYNLDIYQLNKLFQIFGIKFHL